MSTIFESGPQAVGQPDLWHQPAVDAAIVTATVAVIVLLVNTILNARIHRDKIESDRVLAYEKFEFDQRLAE
jgi:hypothetical protein